MRGAGFISGFLIPREIACAFAEVTQKPWCRRERALGHFCRAKTEAVNDIFSSEGEEATALTLGN